MDGLQHFVKSRADVLLVGQYAFDLVGKSVLILGLDPVGVSQQAHMPASIIELREFTRGRS